MKAFSLDSCVLFGDAQIPHALLRFLGEVDVGSSTSWLCSFLVFVVKIHGRGVKNPSKGLLR
jgi:hypothetical protein